MESYFLITVTLGAAILFLIFYWLAKRNVNYWKDRGVPFIKSEDSSRILKDIIFMKKSLNEILDEYYNILDGEKLGGYFQVSTPAVVLRDPELINNILIKDFTYFEDRQPPIKNAKDLFSLGIGNLSGDEWRNVRHKMTPAFTSGKLKMMFGSIIECCDEAIEYIKESAGQDIESREFMLRCILNVIGDVAFGLKLNTLNTNDEQSKEFYKNASTFLQPTLSVFIKTAIHSTLPKLKEILGIQLMDNNVESFFRKLTNDVIKYRETTNDKRNDFLNIVLDLKSKEQELLKIGSVNDNRTTPSSNMELMDSEDEELIDQLRKTPHGSRDSRLSEIFTNDFIASQAFLFIAGGGDTSAGVLSFVFYELAVNQHIQKKVQEEITRVLSVQEFNYDAVQKMTYLEQCINETFRIHPPVTVLMRICKRDYKIPGTDVIIEKGTFVNIPVRRLHNDPQYFPEPEKFNPDRFQNMDAIPKGVFFPFGSGPRMCIAMRFAMLEMKMILATILLNYTVFLSEKTKLPLKLIRNAVIPRPEGGIWVKFKKREL